MKIDLVFITYNRLEYTKLSLASVLADPTEEFSLTIWDNASTDGTVEYLKNEVSDPRIKEKIFSTDNIGQTEAVNKIWSKSKADLLGKLDNDCVVTPGWTRILAKAHQDILQLGVIAMWHFLQEDFDYERAKHKIQEFNGHKIFRHPWTCGTGFLIKRETFEQMGPIKKKAMTNYWIRMARKGYVNGFYFPLIFQEHMDDPRTPHTLLKTEEIFRRSFPVTAKNFSIRSLKEWEQFLRDDAIKIQAASINPKHCIGWLHKLRRGIKRLLGR